MQQWGIGLPFFATHATRSKRMNPLRKATSFPYMNNATVQHLRKQKANASQKLFATIDSILFYLFLPISGECQRFRKRATVFATSFPSPQGFLPKKFFFCHSLPLEICLRSSFASSSRLQRFPPTAVSEHPGRAHALAYTYTAPKEKNIQAPSSLSGGGENQTRGQ